MPDEKPAATAIAVRELIDVAFIDGGDTVSVRFVAADGQVVGVVIPRKVFAELQATAPDGPGHQR